MYSRSDLAKYTVLGVMAALVGGLSATAGEPIPLSPAVAKVIAKQYPKNAADLRAIQAQVRKVVDGVRPTVVAVQIGGSVGSGVIVSADGLVLTAGHVVIKPNLPVTFFFPDGSRARGRSLGLNRSIDSGMLRITDPGPWPFTPTAAPGKLAAGEWVITLGQPNGYFRDRAPPVRLGRVLSADDEVIHTDCTLVGGDSGGPLLNLKGEVVGIHSRIMRAITSNFHVPISAYTGSWGRLIAGQEFDDDEELPSFRPLIGLAGIVEEAPCRVTQVFSNQPAARAGIQQGDIVRRFNGETIDTFGDLARMVLKHEPEETVTLDVERDGETLKISVLLGRIAQGYPGSLRSPKTKG